MRLVNEKKRINEEIEGKDEALTAPKRERITEINTRLEQIARGEGVVEEVVTEEVVETPTYEAPTQVTSPTAEAFATVNRNDGKGTVTLTEAEYNTEMERFAPAEVTNEEVIAELTIRGLAATKENQKQVRFELEQEKKEVAPAEEAVVEEAALVEEKERGFFGKILDKVFKKEKIDEDVQLTEEQKEQGIQDVYDEQIKYLESNIEKAQKEGNSVLEDMYKRDLEELKSKSPTQYLERDLEIQKDMPQRHSDAAKKGEYPSLYNKEYVSRTLFPSF